MLPASPASSWSLPLAEGGPSAWPSSVFSLSQFCSLFSLPPPWVSYRFSHLPHSLPILWSLRPPCPAHLFVISVGLLSPVLRPPGFLCLLFREVRAEPLAASLLVPLLPVMVLAHTSFL